MDLKMFSLTAEQLSREMNKGKELIIEQLERDGLLKASASALTNIMQ
jgi:hypothetical protein